jgi:hypothetical protein
MPLFNSNCNEYNLSRDCVIAAAELRQYTLTLQTVLLRHSRKTILGLIRGIIASN